MGHDELGADSPTRFKSMIMLASSNPHKIIGASKGVSSVMDLGRMRSKMVRCQELCAAKTSVLASEATPQIIIFHLTTLWCGVFWPVWGVAFRSKPEGLRPQAPATRRKIAHVQLQTITDDTP